MLAIRSAPVVAAIVCSAWVSVALADGISAVVVDDLRCQYRRDPLGVDVAQPRLSWILQSNERGQRQMAYEICVASTAERLSKDEDDLWRSGRVESDQSNQVAYAGKPLVSHAECFWKVRVWDRDGKLSPWSQPASWTMGFLKSDQWSSQWIRMKATALKGEAESPWFRKTFDLDAKPQRALAYVNSLGYHELYVNGRKVGTQVLNPAVCNFGVRTFYIAYDIAPLLRPGRNCIGLWLGRGWYIPEPQVRFQGEILIDGRRITVVSDSSWKCAPSSYFTLGECFQRGGERYDARRENPRWCFADFDERAWVSAEVLPAFGSRAESQSCPSNRIGKRIAAVACQERASGVYTLDFGTNLTGWMRLRMPRLAAGHRIVMQYAEANNGGVANNPESIGPTYEQRDEFISAGRSGEEFCSKFHYHGFRYATIEGLPSKPNVADAEALLVDSDLEPAGSFACSNELLNRIYRLNMWTVRCLNLGGYMVDCPHRERMGYGDGQNSFETCAMNLWMPNFYAKWLADWRQLQNPQTGDLPHVAPSIGGGGGGPGWGGFLAAVAWRTYLYYGDRRVLEESYEPMRRYGDYLESRCTNNILRNSGGVWDFIGDWVAPGHGQGSPNCFLPPRVNEAFNNCYRIFLWDLLEKSAAALGRPDEVRRCQAKLNQLRPLIHREFYDPGKHTYASEDQTYQCFPLWTGVTPPSQREAVLDELIHGILVRRNGHLDTGHFGTYFLFQYLPTVHRDDLLFTIVNQRTYPGWGHMLEKGATTIWEEWEGGNSHIHSCFLSVAGWFLNGLAGIQIDPSVPAFKKIMIRPAVVGDLTWVKASHRSVYGTILSEWKRQRGTFSLNVTIPPNTTATIYIPTQHPNAMTESGRAIGASPGVKYLRQEDGYALFAAESGTYSFAIALESCNIH